MVAPRILLSSPGNGGTLHSHFPGPKFQVPSPMSQVPVPVAWLLNSTQNVGVNWDVIIVISQIKTPNSQIHLCILSCQNLDKMLRFILVFCFLFCLVNCDKTPDSNEDNVVTKTVKEIISGERKGQDIPEDLRIVSQFYENPKPELFSKQEISLTCLGRKNHFYFKYFWNIHFNMYCNYSFSKISRMPLSDFTVSCIFGL